MSSADAAPAEKTGTACRLCLRVAPLARSHVIPEFIFASLYDEKHRFIEVVDMLRGRVTRGQKGYRERLLCSECESLVNRYERHARRLFVDPLPAKVSRLRRTHHNLEYARLKLFFLSVLWRASISSLDVFKHVELGPHEERVRQAILRGDPGPPEVYATMIWVLNFNGEQLRDFIVEPTHMRVEGRKCYRFVMGGFVILMFVAAVPAPHPYPLGILDPTRPVHSFDSELSDWKFLAYAWETTARTTRDVVL